MKHVDFLQESNAIENVFDNTSLKYAIRAWDYVIHEPVLTDRVIRKTHKILMTTHLRGSELGQFRKCRVWIGGREGMKHELIPQAIYQWCEVIKLDKTREEIKNSHIKYEHIHPFVDGNGRTGRIFLNWQRIKNGLDVLVIKASERQKYYEWFRG